ncbi:MAG: hypothetical protein KUG81_07365 [Gammaproteobacteria bacterium]|nr:hypothetical protein [Gammaproteobacteria bacterium]
MAEPKQARRNWTKKQMVQEIITCTKSAEYFLSNHGWVYHPRKGHVKFDLFEYQVESLESYQQNRFNIVLKSRQTGFSTLTAGYIAWLIMFHKAKEIVVVANKQDNAQGFIRKIKTFIKLTPDWMVPALESDNMKSIVLANGSKVTAQATTGDAGRSESLSLLVIDEAAMIENSKADDLWAAAYPTLSLGGSAIIISTPKGVASFYHKQWLASVNKESDFQPLVAHWTDHPVYGGEAVWDCQKCGGQQDHGNMNPLKPNVVCVSCGENSLLPTSPWYVEQKKQLGDPRKVAQELDMDFLGSGDQVITEEFIKNAEKECKVPLRIGGWDNNLWVWVEPETDHEYLISADVARGDGSDHSACHVIDLHTRQQVAEYKGKLPPDLYAKFLMELGYEYNEALLVTEANSVGYATCLKLVEDAYPNIFYSIKGMHGRDRNKLEKAYKNKESMVPGFQTTLTTRPLLIAQLEQEVRTGTFTIRSTRLISELRTLIYHNGRPEAMHGYNDDLAISAGIALFVMSTTLSDMLATKDSILATLKALSHQVDTEVEDLKILNRSFANSMNTRNPWQMTTSNGVNEDLTWLLSNKKKG